MANRMTQIIIIAGLEIAQCGDCLRYKPREYFTKKTRSRSGLEVMCKKCRRKAAREYSRINRSAMRANSKKWRGSSAGKKSIAKANQKYKKANKRKSKIHNDVSRAIKQGKLERGVCEVCGNRKTHGHHDDYSKPLEVRWLCNLHHVHDHKNI